MSDCMTFPETVEEFMEFYRVVDTEQVYSNGTEYVPIFRMRQWFEHLQSIQPCTDTISRQQAIDAFDKEIWSNIDIPICKGIRSAVKKTIEQIPSVQPCTDTISRAESEKRTNKRTETHSCDCISRQDAIEWCLEGLNNMPSAQPDAIPLEWIAKHLEWLDNCDNDFAQLAKVSIRAMVEIWKMR